MSYVYERRLKKVSEEAAKKEAEAAVITSSTNIFYLTGYEGGGALIVPCLLYTSPSPRDRQKSRMPSSA